MNSFSILRTNVGLTTNVKVMVSSNYNLFLDSIDSDAQLSDSKYKKVQFNKNTYYDEIVPYFYNGLPVDIAYKVKYDDDNDNMFNTFDKQFDDIYQMGCRNIINNKNYNEEFECFAPLYVGDENFPKKFIVLRIDGPGLVNLNKDNFRSEIVDNFKCVKIFDLTKNTPLGEWINNNYVQNQYFPASPFYMDYRSLEFSSWNGIDYEVGGYTSKSFFLDSALEYESTFSDFEKLVYDGYKNNKVIFPNIINFSFLFDDTPATPDTLRKWSINRYMGFYLDEMEIVYNFSPYLLPELKSDVVISGGNLLTSQSSDSPFIDSWDIITSPYIEVDGKFYKVERYIRTSKAQFSKVRLSKTVYSDEVKLGERYYYKIISDVDLMGITHSSINSNLVQINDDNSIELLNGNVLISDYDLADVWLIDIDGKYHVIKESNGVFYIQSDYGFTMSSDKLQYWINSPDTTYKTTLNLKVDGNPNLIPFKIYKCKFTDIKDFDTSIVETEYSKFEYSKISELTYTDEPKMYTLDYDSKNNPKDYNDYIVNGKVVNIPVSSEYTANGETFRIVDNDLSNIWRKNSSRSKWGYQNSLSSNDYPYLLNNSFLSEDFNRTTNPFDPIPNRKERNLDYFYSVNSSTASYSYHSLHVESIINGNIDTNFSFELDKYLDTTYDYFSYFFGKKSTFNNGDEIVNTKKWSVFEVGDNVIPNTTLFRGLKFNLYDVEDIKVSDGNIDDINLKSLNTYQGYKFSILLSKNDYKVSHSASDISVGDLSTTNNLLTWYVIDNWVHNKAYSTNDIVSYYDILYKASTSSTITDPTKNPSTETSEWENVDWSPSTSIFWTPSFTFSSNDFIYNKGEYYYYDSTGNTFSFWNPFKSYGYNDVIRHDNKTWISTTQSNTIQPGSSNVWRSEPSTITSAVDTVGSTYFWVETSIKSDWSIVEIWSPIYTYGSNYISKPNTTITTPGYPYVVYNEILYQLNSSYSSGDIPGISNVWNRKYSMVPDTNYQYNLADNPIILLNNKYYQCTAKSDSTLENGISVYINKKYKNVLVNIYVNDNTLPDISSVDRDSLYNDIYSNITALNFTNAISDLSNKFGFSDYLQYVIINEDGSLEIYDFDNITSLPCMLTYQAPDRLFSRVQSLLHNTSTLEVSQFKPKRKLDNGSIVTIDMLNYYNSNGLGTEISKRKDDPSIIENYHGLKNNIYNSLYRYSGYYCPIFYTIPLFEAPGMTSSAVGNYKFDTELTNFGMMKERVISKINRKSNILKLRFNPDIKSIYPMLDEFGYTFTDYFIFKSTWDNEYYIECLDIDQNTEVNLTSNKILKS